MTATKARGLLGLIATGAGIVAATFLASPAHADQYDYIAALDSRGVTYQSVTDMINVGKDICHELRTGYQPGAIVNQLATGGWSEVERAFIMGEAVHSMCPDTTGVILNWADHSRPVPQSAPPSTVVRNSTPI